MNLEIFLLDSTSEFHKIYNLQKRLNRQNEATTPRAAFTAQIFTCLFFDLLRSYNDLSNISKSQKQKSQNIN